VEKGAHLQSLHKAPVDEPPTKFPSGALPNRFSAKREDPFSELSNYLLKFPVNGLPRFPIWPIWRETSVSTTLFYTFPSQSPVNEPSSMFPNRVHMERALSPEPMVYSFIHSFISVRVPNTEPSQKKGEGNIWSPSTKPHVDGRPTHNGVRPGSPRESFTILHSLLQCHAAFSTIPSTLAWVDQSPVSQRVS
jgi:hypothetical protein